MFIKWEINVHKMRISHLKPLILIWIVYFSCRTYFMLLGHTLCILYPVLRLLFLTLCYLVKNYLFCILTALKSSFEMGWKQALESQYCFIFSFETMLYFLLWNMLFFLWNMLYFLPWNYALLSSLKYALLFPWKLCFIFSFEIMLYSLLWSYVLLFPLKQCFTFSFEMYFIFSFETIAWSLFLIWT